MPFPPLLVPSPETLVRIAAPQRVSLRVRSPPDGPPRISAGQRGCSRHPAAAFIPSDNSDYSTRAVASLSTGVGAEDAYFHTILAFLRKSIQPRCTSKRDPPAPVED